jgi:hypothetical protein
MPESFDDFSRKHDEDKSDKERLAKAAKAQWELLKGLVKKFATEGRRFDGHQFSFIDVPLGPLLVLKNVSAALIDKSTPDKPVTGYQAVFSRKPDGPLQAYSDDESPLSERTWNLELGLLRDEFIWIVDGQVTQFYPTSACDEIAKELGRYHLEYELALKNSR